MKRDGTGKAADKPSPSRAAPTGAVIEREPNWLAEAAAKRPTAATPPPDKLPARSAALAAAVALVDPEVVAAGSTLRRVVAIAEGFERWLRRR